MEVRRLSPFDALVRLLHVRWRGQAEESALDNPRLQRFHRFLKGAERVKYLWPVRERVTVDAEIYSAANSGAQFVRALHASRQVAAALAKSARNMFGTCL